MREKSPSNPDQPIASLRDVRALAPELGWSVVENDATSVALQFSLHSHACSVGVRWPEAGLTVAFGTSVLRAPQSRYGHCLEAINRLNRSLAIPGFLLHEDGWLMYRIGFPNEPFRAETFASIVATVAQTVVNGLETLREAATEDTLLDSAEEAPWWSEE